MRGKGINYDTGFSPGGRNSREDFDAGIVRREMHVIARELHCTAVRVSGGDPGRLSVAGELAAAEGLEVWFAPFPCELTTEQLAPLFADCADRAEHLRRAGRSSRARDRLRWKMAGYSSPPRPSGHRGTCSGSKTATPILPAASRAAWSGSTTPPNPRGHRAGPTRWCG